MNGTINEAAKDAWDYAKLLKRDWSMYARSGDKTHTTAETAWQIENR